MTNHRRPQWPSSSIARLLAAICLGLTILAGAPAARAQNDVQTLSDKVDRLQQELSDVERQVYNGQVPAGSAADAGSGAAAASQEVRIQQLETQLSNLTGQLETLSYNLQQLSTRLDKLSQDVDFRLSALEHGQPPGAGAAAVGTPVGGANGVPALEGQGATQPLTPPPGQPPVLASDPNAPLKQSSLTPTTLGTLSQTQLQTSNTQPPAGGTAPAAAAATTTTTTTTTGAYQLPGNTVEAQYEYAFNLLRQANYDEAEKALRAFVNQHPTDFLAGNAQYWLGETYYVRGRYQDAAVAFAEGYQKYPNNSKAPDNLLKLGMALGQIGKKSDACVAFSELNKKFPGAPDSLKERTKQEKHRYGCS